jgi:FKBP-type peptidyl-prolyl cis-trans isomerase FkpA
MFISSKQKQKRLALFITGLFLLCGSCFDDNEIDFDKQLKEDLAIIDQYLSDQGIVALSDSTKQIRYVIHKNGIGEIPTRDTCCINATYVGKILGTEANFTGAIRRSFPMGGDLIDGWKLFIPLLHAGDSVTFYIPSGLAYGPSGIPNENIPPNANVYFHFKLMHIGKVYSPSPQPAGSCN